MSTRNLALAGRSGHDQFFAAFRTFGPVSRLRVGDTVAEVATRAVNQRTFYVELMVSVQNVAVRQLGRQIGLGSDYASTHRRLLAADAGLRKLVAEGQRELEQMETESRQAMECDGVRCGPGLRSDDPVPADGVEERASGRGIRPARVCGRARPRGLARCGHQPRRA